MKKTFCDICGEEKEFPRFYINIMEKCLGESPTYHKQYEDVCDVCVKAIIQLIDNIRSTK